MRCVVVVILLHLSVSACAQSVESYAGHSRYGVDLMWFRFFKTPQERQTPLLFFSRNRASTDYDGSGPLFGSVNAVSYNFKSGIGLVSVASFTNTGVVPKTGIQYYATKSDFLFFGWLVVDVKTKGNVDLFGMFRYQPKLNGNWRIFSQLELFPVYKPDSGFRNLTQRLRLGLKQGSCAAGLMADFNQSGRHTLSTTNNAGGFLRVDF